MSNQYAIYQNDIIENVIVAESKKDAEFCTKMNAIEVIDNAPQLGWAYTEEYGWRPPSPYPSWVWQNNEWIAPVQHQEDYRYIWVWNEDYLEWDRYPLQQPYPSWILDDDDLWQPPIPYPQSDQPYYWDEDSQSWIFIEEQ